MSSRPEPEVIEAIEDGTVLLTRRVEIYEKDGETPWYPEGPGVEGVPRLLQGGSVSLEYGRDERRLLDVMLDNFDNLLKPHPGGFWYDKIIKPYRGVYLGDGSIREWQLGEFMIDNIDQENFPHHVKVVGRDYTKKMILSKLVHSTSFDASVKLHELVFALAANSGVAKLERLPSNTPELGKKLDVERGTDRWSIAKDAAQSKGYDLYFDSEGYLRLELFPDPALGAVEWTFKTGPQGNLASYSRSINDSELYNVVLVVGETPEDGALPFYYLAKNKEPSSPTNIEALGERMAPVITLASAASVKDCRIAARNFLKVAGLESYNMNFSSILYPWLEVGIVTNILEPDRLLTDPTRYLLTNLTIPLDLGPASGQAKRITIVGELHLPDEDEEVPPEEVPDDPGDPDEPEEEPTDPVEPPDNPSGNTEEVRITTYNLGFGRATAKVVNSLELLAGYSDIICIQEGADAIEALQKFLRKNDAWRIWKGNSNPKQAVSILYRKGLGKVTGKKHYLAHKRKFVGNRGVTPTISDKYVTRLEIKLDITGRTINVFNTHMLPSVTRSRKSLGAEEYQRRRDHFQKHLSELTQRIDAAGGLKFGCGDYNATPPFSLLNPLWNSVTLDHNFDTHGNRCIDFVYHANHGAIAVLDTKKTHAGLSSDHDAVTVTYGIRKA